MRLVTFLKASTVFLVGVNVGMALMSRAELKHDEKMAEIHDLDHNFIMALIEALGKHAPADAIADLHLQAEFRSIATLEILS